MATHDANIENLRTATIGEQVRGSMIQLFEEDYNLVKRGITIGTDITSASSPTTGYYDGNVYLNSDTLDLWKLAGTVWTRQGNLKGVAQIITQESTADGGNNIVTFVLTDGTRKSFNVKNGSKGSTGVSVTGVVDNGDGTFYLTLSDGNKTANVATIQGLKGEKGDKGDKGNTGEKGRDVTSILMSGTGKEHPVTATYSDGTTQVIGVLKDGNDGEGTGNMHTDTYDPTKSGIVGKARELSDGTISIPVSAVQGKADKSTTLKGYGIEDAYDKTEIDNMFASVASDWDSVTDKPFDSLSTDFKAKTVGDKKQLALADSVTEKLAKLDIDENVSTALGKKADNSTSLSGYGITDAYTKTEVDNKLDSTVKTSTVGSDGKTVSFTNVDTSKCYKPFADVGTSFTDRKPVGLESMTLNGTTLTYVLTNASAGMQIKLREIKL